MFLIFSFPDKLLVCRKFGFLASVMLNLMQWKMEFFLFYTKDCMFASIKVVYEWIGYGCIVIKDSA